MFIVVSRMLLVDGFIVGGLSKHFPPESRCNRDAALVYIVRRRTRGAKRAGKADLKH
jgi:hypothetical protein